MFKKNGFVLSMIFLQSNQVVVPRHRADTSIVPSDAECRFEDERFESLDPDEFSTRFHEDFELWICGFVLRLFSDFSVCKAATPRSAELLDRPHADFLR